MIDKHTFSVYNNIRKAIKRKAMKKLKHLFFFVAFFVNYGMI